jgi:hypothetical protein
MSDDMPEKPAKPQYQPLQRLKRLVIFFAALFLIWAIFPYILTALMGVRTAPAPVAPVNETLVPSPDTQARIDALESRVKALEEQAAVPRPATETAAPDTRVNALAEQMTSQQTLVADLKQSIEESNRRLAALTLFGQIKDAALRGEGYRDQLRELTALMQGRGDAVPLLAKLSATAENGAPTLAALQVSFSVTIDKALSPTASSAWQDKMRSLIRVRKVGEGQKGDDDEAIIARAEAKLAQGNVAEALKELTGLSPPAGLAMKAWKNQAGDFVQVQDALDMLHLALFAKSGATQP